MKIRINRFCEPRGSVAISGAKNSATKLMAAALLSDERTTIYNFPTDLEDVKCKAEYISDVGAFVELDDERDLAFVSGSGLEEGKISDVEPTFRTTYLLAAPSLYRYGLARIPYPGGCKIGDRKYDLHIMVWEAFGARVEEKEKYIEVRCTRMKAAKIKFPITTMGGTENALLCAACVPETSVIENAYVTPETVNLIELLEGMGAYIELSGTSNIHITGARKNRGSTIVTIADRIEAITWLIYGIVSGGNIVIENVPFEIMKVPLLHLKHAGIDYFSNTNKILINGICTISGGVQPFEIACGTHPGIISDMQPFFVLLGLFARGTSRIFDYRYPKRTEYLKEVGKFSPDSLMWKDGEITTIGPASLVPADAVATDLRGTAATIFASLLSAKGSTVSGIETALRGYSKFLHKCEKLGIDVEQII